MRLEHFIHNVESVTQIINFVQLKFQQLIFDRLSKIYRFSVFSFPKNLPIEKRMRGIVGTFRFCPDI